MLLLDVLLVLFSFATAPLMGRYAAHYGSVLSEVFSYVGQAVQLGLGALIVNRRPRHLVGWILLAAVSVAVIDQAVVSNFVIYAVDISHRAVPGGDLVGSFEAGMWVLFVVPIATFLPLVFPTGRLLSPRWRPVAVVTFVALITGFISSGLNPSRDSSSYIAGVHPVVLPAPYAAITAVLSTAFVAAVPLMICAGIAALVVRYRRGASDERHQIKWLAFAIAIAGTAGSASLILGTLGHPIQLLQDLDVIGLALIPVAAALAVLKYRLYDIDIAISRTLVYGSLAAFITLVYVAIVVGVGTLVGNRANSSLALSIVATGVVAVAFQPLRDRLQRVANHLVYGRRATPYEVLSEFSARVAEGYVGTTVLERMAHVLADGTGADRAEVWMRHGNTLRPVAGWPDLDDAVAAATRVTGEDLPLFPGADRAAPVHHQGELLGALTVTKRKGESLTPIEERLLDDLAHQAGLVLKNVGLTADLRARLDDLRASRQRLVAAQDEERRRLERNLHDGAQQHLVALKVKLGLAELLLDRDPERAVGTIEQLKSDADEALETLRDLARGIYPPLLADRGLVPALESQARKATIDVEVLAEGVERYPQETEAAVYFLCLEALQNVQKYAAASRAELHLRGEPGGLRVEVRDNGKGFDPGSVKRGAGLQNMEDRLASLGGELELESTPGTGTLVRGWVPLLIPVAAA